MKFSFRPFRAESEPQEAASAETSAERVWTPKELRMHNFTEHQLMAEYVKEKGLAPNDRAETQAALDEWVKLYAGPFTVLFNNILDQNPYLSEEWDEGMDVTHRRLVNKAKEHLYAHSSPDQPMKDAA